MRSPDREDATSAAVADRCRRVPWPPECLERAGRCVGRPLTGVTLVEARGPSRPERGAVSLATALSPTSVRIDPVLRHGPPRLRFLLLAHELPHTVQLDRLDPGPRPADGGDLIFPFDNGRPNATCTSHIQVSRPGSDVP